MNYIILSIFAAAMLGVGNGKSLRQAKRQSADCCWPMRNRQNTKYFEEHPGGYNRSTTNFEMDIKTNNAAYFLLTSNVDNTYYNHYENWYIRDGDEFRKYQRSSPTDCWSFEYSNNWDEAFPDGVMDTMCVEGFELSKETGVGPDGKIYDIWRSIGSDVNATLYAEVNDNRGEGECLPAIYTKVDTTYGVNTLHITYDILSTEEVELFFANLRRDAQFCPEEES